MKQYPYRKGKFGYSQTHRVPSLKWEGLTLGSNPLRTILASEHTVPGIIPTNSTGNTYVMQIWKQRGEWCIQKPTSPEILNDLHNQERGMRVLSRDQSCQRLNFGLPASRPGRQYVSVVEVISLWYSVTAVLWQVQTNDKDRSGCQF